MADLPPAADAFLERFVAWAQARRDLRGALVVGSRARATEPADALSDLDLLLVTTRPRFYASTRDWLGELGDVFLTCTYSSIVGTRAVRAADFDVEGELLHVDFAIVGSLEARMSGPLFRLLARCPGALRFLPPALRAEVGSWFAQLRKGRPRVLFERGRAASRMIARAPLCAGGQRAPGAAEFDELVHSFLDLGLWQSKLLLRGELWMALHFCDRLRKERLLRMLEWHARATREAPPDTWYEGRFLERWADRRALAELGHAFGHFEGEDAWRALFATSRLFAWLARETAERLGFPDPAAAEARVDRWLERRFAERAGERGGAGSSPSGSCPPGS